MTSYYTETTNHCLEEGEGGIPVGTALAVRPHQRRHAALESIALLYVVELEKLASIIVPIEHCRRARLGALADRGARSREQQQQRRTPLPRRVTQAAIHEQQLT